MKKVGLPVLLGIIFLQSSGCIAIPPLITVKESNDSGLRSKVEDLERRVQRLEEQSRK